MLLRVWCAKIIAPTAYGDAQFDLSKRKRRGDLATFVVDVSRKGNFLLVAVKVYHLADGYKLQPCRTATNNHDLLGG
jgi:hypothetical protein